MKRGVLAVLALVALSGCQSRKINEPPTMPVDDLVAQLPAPWNVYRERPEDSENGFVRFREIVLASEKDLPSLTERARDMTGAERDAVVARFEPWIEDLKTCLAMDYFVAPLPKNGVATLFPEYAKFKAMQKGIVFSAESALLKNDKEQAVQLLLVADRFGDAASMAGGTMIGLIVGLALDAISHRAIVEAVTTTDFSEDQLKRLMTAWGRQDVVELTTAALMDEVQGTTATEFARHKIQDAELEFTGDDSGDWHTAHSTVFSGNSDPFDRVESARIVAEAWGRVIDLLRVPYGPSQAVHQINLASVSPWSETELHDFMDWPDKSLEELQSLRSKVKGVKNSYGKFLAGIMLPDPESFVAVLTIFKARGETLKAVVGARLFEKRRGRLPANLDELVTAGILKAAPTDPFSGGELRYDSKRRVVWSVGEDLKNDGGAGEAFKREPDIVVPF
jgi:hypothetical protein